jgi:transposase
MDIESLCPDPSHWRIALISPRPDRIVIHLEPRRREAHCPLCGTLSQRIHSHYFRRPWDLNWGHWPVQLYIVARRFFCDCPDCPCHIFAEPFPDILKYYSRQTSRLQTALLEIAHNGSAEGASRLAKVLGYFTSGDSLLKLQRRETVAIHEPRVVGIDEFSLRRSPEIIYGTLIVDEERHLPIAVLHSDQMEPVAEWLKSHPSIAIITRDRDQTYANAAKLAVPNAIQIADRFHLAQNAGEALKNLFKAHTWKLPAPDKGKSPLPIESPVIPEVFPGKMPQPSPVKQVKWEVVKKKGLTGHSINSIVSEMGMCRRTVRRYLSLETPPIYTPRPPAQRKISPFLAYLRQRWEEGCYNASKLYREIKKVGYQGKDGMVRQVLRAWRKNQGKSLKPIESPPLLSRLLLKSQHKLKAEDKTKLAQILELNPPLSTGYHLKEQFLEIIRQKDVGGLLSWLEEAARCGLKSFQGMVTGIQRDIEAVKNALILPWSNSQCEGQICRVKLIKRAGYGRAKVDLLRQRILHRLTRSPQF